MHSYVCIRTDAGIQNIYTQTCACIHRCAYARARVGIVAAISCTALFLSVYARCRRCRVVGMVIDHGSGSEALSSPLRLPLLTAVDMLTATLAMSVTPAQTLSSAASLACDGHAVFALWACRHALAPGVTEGVGTTCRVRPQLVVICRCPV